MSREGKRKPGAGRKRGALKRASLADPNLPLGLVLHTCFYGEKAAHLAKICDAFLAVRHFGREPLPDTPWGRMWKAKVEVFRMKLGTWLGEASPDDLRLFLEWASRPNPGEPVDPIGFFLTQLRMTQGGLKNLGGMVHHETAECFLSRTPIAELESWLARSGKAVTRDAVVKAAQAMGAQRSRGRPRKPKP